MIPDQLIAQLPATAAVLFITIYFLKFIKEERVKQDETHAHVIEVLEQNGEIIGENSSVLREAATVIATVSGKKG